MNSVANITSYQAIASLLNLVKAQEPILDVTYGNGVFWKGSTRKVVGCDLNPKRAKDFIEDFTALSFVDAQYPTVVFDPPFHPFVNSHENKRYSGLGKNEKELKELFMKGTSEAWRVTKHHLIVKCQGFIHNHSPQWMPLWAIEICGEPFEWLIVSREQKLISGRWKEERSLRRNHADYLLFSKYGNKR